MTVQPCPEHLSAPCTSGSRGLQRSSLGWPPPSPASEEQTPPRGRLAPPLLPGHAPGRSALEAAGWGRRCSEVGAQLWPRVRRALSRQSRPCPGCSHGKAVGRGAGPGRAGPTDPGQLAGTCGAAARAVPGGRRCRWPRAQANTARSPFPAFGAGPYHSNVLEPRCSWTKGWVYAGVGHQRISSSCAGEGASAMSGVEGPRPCLDQLLPG